MKSTQSSESPKSLPRFDAPIGPTARTKSSKSPLAVLQLFLTVAILKSIVLQTNTFAESKGVRLDLHVEELQAFLGMNMGKGHWVFMVQLFFWTFWNITRMLQVQLGVIAEIFQCSKAQEKQDLGNYHFSTSGDLLAVRWTDRRNVYMLSTAHNTSVGVAMKRPKGSREKHPIPCPTCVSDYNEYMGDQHISYYNLSQRRILKWWKKCSGEWWTSLFEFMDHFQLIFS